MERSRIFLDSSVIVSALLSAKGGSFYILHRSSGKYSFVVNEYVFSEVKRVLNEKFSDNPELTDRLFLLLGTAEVKVLVDPSNKQVREMEKYISKEDAPVLAGAFENADILLTLDKEFFGSPVADFSKRKNLFILSPKEFIELFRKE